MPFQIIRQDITKMHCDAIVNAAKNSLLGGGGVDGAIHRAAGPELLEECRGLGGCETGDAQITRGYALPSAHVIHTVGPVWQGGGRGEEALLRSCYRRSLEVALENECKSVAFPLISAGVFGYPKDQAMRVAVDEIGKFLLAHDMTVYLVVFGHDSFLLGSRLYADVRSYIDDHYAETHDDSAARRKLRREAALADLSCNDASVCSIAPETIKLSTRPKPTRPAASGASVQETLDERLKTLDESFSEMLLRLIDERGIKDSDCYKKANVDRKLFSKIRNNHLYKPSKPTALAFAVALELSLPETRELLRKAGFALSGSSKFDVIVQYFIETKNYSIFAINEALFAFDQSLLGGVS